MADAKQPPLKTSFNDIRYAMDGRPSHVAKPLGIPDENGQMEVRIEGLCGDFALQDLYNHFAAEQDKIADMPHSPEQAVREQYQTMMELVEAVQSLGFSKVRLFSMDPVEHQLINYLRRDPA